MQILQQERCKKNLKRYRTLVYETILNHQDPITGLIPSREEEGHAWIRDNTYAIHCCWGLCLAYQKLADVDEDIKMARELEHRVVKCMRSLLICMMMQASKVEKFKKEQIPINALHAKYNAKTLHTVVGDSEWGHLQIDAVSFYVLSLAQMTGSGLQIIYSLDEVAFVQNLVFYIESAYRIPDYGIWERGDKTNHGLPELNSTSIGMAKAALEAINDLDLFGSKGGPQSIIHVLADESQQCGAVLESMLPRESCSKETDAGLLGIVGYPAFAVDDMNLIQKTRKTILTKLGGRYGCARFLRDGFRTAREDTRRLHYEPFELKMFENIECEWPLFTAYQLLEAIYRDDRVEAEEFATQLEQLVVMQDGMPTVPESYAVASEDVDREYLCPKSQERKPVGRLPHIWSQSLYLLGRMMMDGLLLPGEVDPLGRRMVTEIKPDLVVQVVLVAEDNIIKDKLAQYDMKVQTFDEIHQCSDVKIFPARVLGHFYKHLGKCPKLGLTGRHTTDVGILSTSKLYRVGNQILAFTPQFVDQRTFYLSHDVDFTVDMFRTDINFLCSSWRSMGRPLFIMPVFHSYFNLDDFHPANELHFVEEIDGNVPDIRMAQPPLIKTIKQLQSRYINGTRVVVGNIEDFVTTSCVTQMTFLEPHRGLADEIIAKAGRSSETRKRLASGNSGAEGELDAAGLRAAAIAARRRMSQVPTRMRHATPTDEPITFSIRDTDAVEVTQHLRRPVQPSPSSLSLRRVMASSGLANSLDSGLISSLASMPSTTYLSANQMDGGSSRSSAFFTSARSSTASGLHMKDVNEDNRGSSISLSMMDMDYNQMMDILGSSEDLYEQFEIIIHLSDKYGMDYNTCINGLTTTVRDLLKEVYARAGQMKQWWLARTTAGLLRKRVEDLSKALTDLLVRQKQVTVGPPSSERVIATPLPPDTLAEIIHDCWQVDPSLAMFTQEILVYLAMYARTEPQLFNQMIRIRVGLIIEVMLTELVRTMQLDEAEADAHLMNLSPFEVKKLLHHILSGREFRAEFAAGSNSKGAGLAIYSTDSSMAFSRSMKPMTVEPPTQLPLEGTTEEKLERMQAEDTDRQGQWVRRRMIDGALNRVPPGFYGQLWKLLARCQGIRVGNQYLGQNLTQEMTEGEVKFALQVERIITAVPVPEYRQLLVEALCVLSRLLEVEEEQADPEKPEVKILACPLIKFGTEIVADSLVHRAHKIFLEDQEKYGGDATECCCGPEDGRVSMKMDQEHNLRPCGGKENLCWHFYDSSPSGRFGTMSYLVRALPAVVGIPCDAEGTLDFSCSIQ